MEIRMYKFNCPGVRIVSGDGINNIFKAQFITKCYQLSYPKIKITEAKIIKHD